MLDLRDSENSNWIKNVGQQDEGEGIEKSSPLLTLQEWLDKQSHDNLRPMNPPSRPPHKGAVWNRETHRWSKSGEADLGKQQTMKRGWHDHEGQMPPHPGNVKDHEKYFEEQKEQGGEEQFVEDGDKKAEEMMQPKGQIAQKLKKFNDKVEKILKTLDDLFGGRVDNPQQTFEDLEKLNGEVDQDIDDANTKIDENEGKLDELHESGKIDDDTKERADKELELLRKHYEEQENELNGKWDENYEKLKEKLSLEEEEAAGDEEEEEKPLETEDKPDEDEPDEEKQPDEEKPQLDEEDEEDEEDEDDIFARAKKYEEEEAESYDEDDEADPQWEASAKNSAEHDGATSSGWGGEEHDEEDFNSETGELEVPGKNANDVREWAKELEEKYDVELIGGPTGTEPHDDIYEHYGIEGGHMSNEKIDAQRIADYVKEKTGEEVSFTEREKPTEEPKAEPIPIKDDSYVHGLQNRRRELYQDIDELDREWNKINDMPERNNADKAAKREAMQDREPEIISQKKAHRLELRDVKAKLADVPTKEPKSEEPTVESTNAQTLLDRTTNSTTELKATRKDNKDRLKSLQNKLTEIDDDEPLKEKTLQQIKNTKDRIDTINTSLKTQTRKLDMANALLNKKPSLNGKDSDTKDEKQEFPKTMDFRNDPEGAKRYADKHREEMRQELGITDEELDEKLKEIGAKIDFSQWSKPKKDSYPKTRVPQEWLTDDDMDDIQEEIPSLDNTQVNELQEWLQQNKN